MDGTLKSVLCDLSLTVGEVVEIIGKKIGLKNAAEFSLQAEGANGAPVWLQKDQPILEQMDDMNQVLLLKKKYFATDVNVDKEDPVTLHLIYVQSRDDILAGKHPTAKDEAIQLAALQCQIEQGNINIQKPNLE